MSSKGFKIVSGIIKAEAALYERDSEGWEACLNIARGLAAEFAQTYGEKFDALKFLAACGF